MIPSTQAAVKAAASAVMRGRSCMLQGGSSTISPDRSRDEADAQPQIEKELRRPPPGPILGNVGRDNKAVTQHDDSLALLALDDFLKDSADEDEQVGVIFFRGD